MNKKTFLNQLKNELRNYPKDEIDEIIYDYEEHFRTGIENGKTEEEIAKTLGDPKMIAKQYKVSTVFKEAEEDKTFKNVVRAIFTVIGLTFMNLIFVIPILAAIAGVLFGLFVAAIAITFAGLVAVFGSIATISGVSGILVGVFSGLILTPLGILMFIGLIYLSKYILLGIYKYFKMNLSLLGNK